ncbi:RNA methyltransferase [Candidatus Peregrinibacteria bacterium]|nr:MAG: RNA methyltransferase [Candidatus Peregrinibacteria bacterium]
MKQRRLVVVLENIRSKFNVGAIFRTSEAFNFEAVVLTGFTPQLPDKEITKTAIGAEKVVPFQYWNYAADALEFYKKEGFSIVSAEHAKNSFSFTELNEKIEGDVCLVLGNEITGVSDETLKYSDYITEIPMLGTVKESLNVEVAFGIIAAQLRFGL